MTTQPPFDLLKPTPTAKSGRNQLSKSGAKSWNEWLAGELGISPLCVGNYACTDSGASSRALKEGSGALRATEATGGSARPWTLTVRVFNDDPSERQRAIESLLGNAGRYDIDLLAVICGDKTGDHAYPASVAASDAYASLGNTLASVLSPQDSTVHPLSNGRPTASSVQGTTTGASRPLGAAHDFDILSDDDIECLLRNWRRTLCLILEGAPGVGKTHIAKDLANRLGEGSQSAVVKQIQFHPSSSYEDFVRGWRPTPDGTFRMRPGVLVQFARDAVDAPHTPHVLVIDEINRGNVAKIFGEMLSLVESTKRNKECAVRLGVKDFHLPPNLYILGLMNTADRALAMVDFALRRRFVFWRLKSAVGSSQFREYLESHEVPAEVARGIMERYGKLNAMIAEEPDLGDGFEVGHSYFCPTPEACARPYEWYADILRTQIMPLLREYASGDSGRLKKWLELVSFAGEYTAEQHTPKSLGDDSGDA